METRAPAGGLGAAAAPVGGTDHEPAEPDDASAAGTTSNLAGVGHHFVSRVSAVASSVGMLSGGQTLAAAVPTLSSASGMQSMDTTSYQTEPIHA